MSRYIAESTRQAVAERAGYGGQTTLDNLAYACFPCNVNKSSDVGTVLLPQRIFVRLFNPRTERWEDHFSVAAGMLYAKTDIGSATIKVLKMNEIERIIERK